LDRISDGGSFTLTSSVTARYPTSGSVIKSMANGAIESFVKAAALEIPRKIRINAVAPALIKENLQETLGGTAPDFSASENMISYLDAAVPSFIKDSVAKLRTAPTPVLSAEDTATAFKAAVEWKMCGKVLDAADYVKTPWTKDGLFF